MQGRDIADLKAIVKGKDVQVEALKKSLAIAQDMNAAAAREARRNRGKATRKALGWALGAFACGWLLHAAR